MTVWVGAISGQCHVGAQGLLLSACRSQISNQRVGTVDGRRRVLRCAADDEGSSSDGSKYVSYGTKLQRSTRLNARLTARVIPRLIPIVPGPMIEKQQDHVAAGRKKAKGKRASDVKGTTVSGENNVCPEGRVHSHSVPLVSSSSLVT